MAFARIASEETSMTMTGLDKWYGYMKSHDRAALWDLLHPDAVFESPVVHTPQRGRDITFKYLVERGKGAGRPRLRLCRRMAQRPRRGARIRDTRSKASRSTASTSSRFDADGRITHFKVMVRPLKAINLLHRLMGEQLAKQ